MHHQTLQYTKDTKSNTHKIYTCLNLQNSKNGQKYTRTIVHQFHSMFYTFTSDKQFTNELINSNDDNNSAKELKIFPASITL